MKENNEYDGYFQNLLEFNRNKRGFVVKGFTVRQIKDYTEQLAWFKFYSNEMQSIFYFNAVTGKMKEELSNLAVYLFEKYLILEKIKFIETIEGMAQII